MLAVIGAAGAALSAAVAGRAPVKREPRAPITGGKMRQLGHKLVAVLFWLLLVLMWLVAVRQHKAGPSNIAYSVQYLSVVAGAVLAVTMLWIRHNRSIYRRKGPREGRPEDPPRVDEDRLGRPLTWAVRGGHYQARRARHLIVDLEDGRKVYRRP
jgi:hypothetical protein